MKQRGGEDMESRIRCVLNYIEEHLKDDHQGVLDNATLARIAGYSEFHFLRLFRTVVHLTPADYIRKRRLSEIVHCIGNSNRPLSDIAFEYGFNSKENFTRAFKKEHGILPTEFRSAGCSLRLYEPFSFEQIDPVPNVSLIYINRFSLFAYPSDQKEPPLFWNRYNSQKRSLVLSGGRVTEDFGAMRWNADTKNLEYYIGVRSTDAKGDVSGTVALNISDGLYAMFETTPVTQHDFVATIRKTWDWIYRVWLPQNGYMRGEGFELECYVETSKKYSERIYVPIKKKE